MNPPARRARTAACAVTLVLPLAACAGATLRPDVAGIGIQVGQLQGQQDRLRAALREAFPDGGAALFREGYALHHRGAHAAAEKLLRDYLRSDPPPSLAGEARAWIGETLFARGLHREALEEWGIAASLLPADERRARLLYRMALAHEALGETGAVRRLLAEVIRQYPDSDAASQARAELGDL